MNELRNKDEEPARCALALLLCTFQGWVCHKLPLRLAHGVPGQLENLHQTGTGHDRVQVQQETFLWIEQMRYQTLMAIVNKFAAFEALKQNSSVIKTVHAQEAGLVYTGMAF